MTISTSTQVAHENVITMRGAFTDSTSLRNENMTGAWSAQVTPF
jgi:hypothetical protein